MAARTRSNSIPKAEEPTSDLAGVQTATERPIWEVIVEIGAQISDEMWSEVPDDAAINYRHYLYGVPKKAG